MSDARPNPFDFDVTKMFADFRFRPFDVEAVWAAQRRNIEALSQANKLAVDGAQALAQRQLELTRQAFEASTEDRIAKNTEYAKQMLEKGISHGREVAALAAKTGTDAAEVLHRRASEGLDEIRAFACKTAN